MNDASVSHADLTEPQAPGPERSFIRKQYEGAVRKGYTGTFEEWPSDRSRPVRKHGDGAPYALDFENVDQCSDKLISTSWFYDAFVGEGARIKSVFPFHDFQTKLGQSCDPSLDP